MSRPRVLIYAESATALHQCWPAAEILRMQLGAHVVMLLGDGAQYLDEQYLDKQLTDYEVYDYTALFRGPLPTPRVVRETETFRSKATFASPSPRSTVVPDAEMESARRSGQWSAYERFKYWLMTVRGVRRFLARIRPDIIVLLEDNIETLSRAFVTFGKHLGVKTIVIPNTVPNPLEPARFYANAPRHQARGVFGWLIRRYLPKWTIAHAGRTLLRLPPIRIVVVEAMGLSTPAPWVLNRGGAAAIALDSEAMRDHYLKLGFPARQLAVVGASTTTELHKVSIERSQRRGEILADLGMTDDKPLIVCAFPPDQHVGSRADLFEFSSFEHLIAAWMRGLQALGAEVNVLIRPHPRLEPLHLAAYERSNVRVTANPTVELVPIADLYVASISATIRWAIACGVPVLNYDSYRYRYGDYAAVGGVVTVEDEAAYSAALERFVRDRDYRDGLHRIQKAASTYWGILDDGFAERLGSLVVKLNSLDRE